MQGVTSNKTLHRTTSVLGKFRSLLWRIICLLLTRIKLMEGGSEINRVTHFSGRPERVRRNVAHAGKNVQTPVSRTLCLWTLVHDTLRTLSVLLCIRLLRVSSAHATVGPEVLVQRTDTSNIQLFDFWCLFKEWTRAISNCLFASGFVWSAVRIFKREQHPRHGFVVLGPCHNEALVAGDHSEVSGCGELRALAGLGELWMEHPAQRLSHLLRLPGKAHGPCVGRHFGFQLERKDCFICFGIVFLSRCRCRCYPLESSSLR